jgi:hypothetical protein
MIHLLIFNSPTRLATQYLVWKLSKDPCTFKEFAWQCTLARM